MKIGIIFLITFYLFSCSTAEKIEEPVAPPVTEAPVESEPVVTYNEEPNYFPASDRDYKRMTRQKMEDESHLNSGAGSLWVMEGQTSFLFAQNKNHQEGDPTVLKVEGSALKQIQMKVATVKDLLMELEAQKKQAIEDEKKKNQVEADKLAFIESEKKKLIESGEAKTEDEAVALADKKYLDRKPASAPKEVVDLKADLKKEKALEPVYDLKELETIPSKIVEKLDSGQYRISGQQYFTIGKRPYKVLMTGKVRQDDFNETSLSSDKVFEAHYDLVHVKKME